MAAPSKTWNIQNYILAALGGTLTVTAVVIIISAIFSPAHISFSVTHAWRSNLTDGDGVRLNLIISANISNQNRTMVKYESIFIDLLNSTTGRDKLHAEVDNTTWPNYYVNSSSPPTTTFNASALLVANSATFEGFSGKQLNISGLTVQVMAQVHFRVGKAPRSRLYGIKVFCYGVHFHDNQTNSVPTAALPISCG